MEIIKSRPDYGLFENNCQNFVRFLAEAISPDVNVWSSVEFIHKQVSTVQHAILPSLPGAYPKSIDSRELSSDSESEPPFTSATTSEGQGGELWSHLDTSSTEEEEPVSNPAVEENSYSAEPMGLVGPSLSTERKKVKPSAHESPFKIDPTLFHSDRLIEYSINLAKDAKEVHQIGIGGFSVVYLVISHSQSENR